ncbi:MAG: DUF953 domain-containing protein [Planctomycetes bacterium]|nr:DUF953 domain-containing protein [Planctomycetota bacterium]
MAIQRCGNAQDLAAIWQDIRAQQSSALFAFFGSEDPGTGESWCKDCVTADPLIRIVRNDLRPEIVLYECPVGERNEWKDQADHAYKVHSQWRLEHIPTLILIENGVERGRLGEQDCQDEAMLRAFMQPAGTVS